ncbi:MAG: response regulator [Marinagarivorans sp.]|nr:response regulator [Marinagarivorans sp.]
MTKRVLIVDDSKTAQLRLRKMLEKFDVDVDISNSAEEALGYLSYRQPSVIFLDHHMEGMSGLSALKIIKSNPATALIPVVMYTSEQGDVYVGQARALGALDIISKEIVQHSNIEKVLSSLGIAGRGNADGAMSDANVADSEFDKPPSRALAASVSTDLIKVQSQVGKLFEIHMAKVRQEIEDSTKFLVRRLSKEIQEHGAAKVTTVARASKPEESSVTVAVSSEFTAPPVSKMPIMGIAVLLIMLVFMAYQLLQGSDALNQRATQLEALIQKERQQNESVQAILAKGKADPEIIRGGTDARVMLDALGWAVNVDPQVPFSQKALGDERIYMLGELLALLKAANFTGTVFIDLHAGNYCVVKSPSGEWILPDEASNTDDCIFLADQNGEISLNDQVSVGFLNYLHSAPVLADGSISVELTSMLYDSPKFSYPPLTGATSAGQWNSAAARNSRLVFSFSPE